MKTKILLFRKSLRLVWESAPGWATVNILISVLQSLLPLALVYLIKLLIDNITIAASSGAEVEFSGITIMIAAVVGLYLLEEIASDFGSFVQKKQSVKLEAFMYDLLHAKSVRVDLINFEHPGYFDELSRAASEAPWRPNSILNNLISLFRGLLSLLLMTGLLVTLHWGFALLLLAVNIPGIWLRLHFADILYSFQRDQTPEARKSAYFNWLLTGDRPSREIRLFGLGNYFRSLFRKSFDKVNEEELEIIKKRTTIELVSNLIKASAIFFLLYIIARQTISGKLTLGQMAMFLLAFRQGMTYMKDLLSSLASLYEDGLFIGDIFGFLELRENIKAASPETIVDGFNSEIRAENLSFTYPGNQKPAINGISFNIRKGEIIALVGPNGAGKSTLVRLLTRLYDPDSGSLMLDGQDIRSMDPDKYRKLFSVVFQDFMLYNITAGENIRLGDLETGDTGQKIKEASVSAGVNDLLMNLPEGYDTPIGNLFENSRELSWGEWQKIALARALFREAPLLILDEPSSSLDADTEFEIFSRFREIVRGKTSFLITHRFTNVLLADRIIVLDNGSIKETGTHKELMEKRGTYYNMYTRQSGRYDKEM